MQADQYMDDKGWASENKQIELLFPKVVIAKTDYKLLTFSDTLLEEDIQIQPLINKVFTDKNKLDIPQYKLTSSNKITICLKTLSQGT
jgi:hypothetical protein